MFGAKLTITALAVMAGQVCAQSESCALVGELRTMAFDHFKRQRKALIEDGNYKTDYLIKGASSCEIRTYEKNYSHMYCEWYIAKGLDSQSKVRRAFEDFAHDFQGCVKDKDGINISNDKDGRGAGVVLVDRAVKSVPGSEFGVRITYSWFAPWWLINLEYYHEDP